MASQDGNWEISVQTLPTAVSWLEFITANTTSSSSSSDGLPEVEARSILIWLQGFEAVPIWLLKIACIIIYVTGAIANALLLTYLTYYKRYKSPVFFIILSLGVADLGMCVGALLWSVVVNPIILGPPWLCRMTVIVRNASYMSSSYHVVIFSILRFFQLVYPLATRAKVTISLLSKICLVIWLADLIHAIGIAIFWGPVKVQYGENNEIYVCWYSGNAQIANIWVIAVWIIAPFLATTGFHVTKHVIVLVNKTDSVAMTSSSDHEQQGRRQTDSRAVALVIVVYLLTVLPTTIQYFRLSVFGVSYTPTEMFLMTIFEQVGFCNSAINPWIYLLAAGSVRSDIRNMLTCSGAAKS